MKWILIMPKKKREERERKPRREDEGDVFLEEYDRSLLDGLL